MREGVFFKNRKDAGEQLGQFLEPIYKKQNPLIIGIPRGGVEVAYYVAKRLHAQLSVVISKKLPLPSHKEYGIGAIAEENSIYLAPSAKTLVSQPMLDEIIEEQRREIDRRIMKYRHGNPLPDMQGRTVIVVDDGIATGVTLVPVLDLCRRKKAAKICLAAPVSGTSFDPHLNNADAIEILVKPPSCYAVGQVYEVFGDFDDDDLMQLLAQAEREQKDYPNIK